MEQYKASEWATIEINFNPDPPIIQLPKRNVALKKMVTPSEFSAIKEISMNLLDVKLTTGKWFKYWGYYVTKHVKTNQYFVHKGPSPLLFITDKNKGVIKPTVGQEVCTISDSLKGFK